MDRNTLTSEEAKKRIDAQLPLSSKMAVADVVVDNSGTPFDLPGRSLSAFKEVAYRLGVRTKVKRVSSL